MASDHDSHSTPIKTPKQLIIVVVLAFVVPISIIIALSQLVTSGERGGRDAKPDEARLLQRIQPVGTVVMADASGPRGNLSGQQVFDQVCKTCHGAGIAGAPKVGDKAAWTARLAQGEKVLLQHAIQGYQGKAGVMPAKGGNPDLADVEVQRAVVLMANQSGGNLKEPPAPAPGIQAAADGASVPAGSVGVAKASPGAGPSTSREASSAAPGAPTPPVPAGVGQGAATTVATASPATGTAAAATPAAGAKPDGKKVYEQVCSVCHGAGIAGAPKVGDKAAWAPRIAQGTNVLYQHAIQGYQGKAGVMPPKGGNTALPDADVRAAVDHMAAASR